MLGSLNGAASDLKTCAIDLQAVK